MLNSALSPPPVYGFPKKREQNVRFSDELEIIPQTFRVELPAEVPGVPDLLDAPEKVDKYEKPKKTVQWADMKQQEEDQSHKDEKEVVPPQPPPPPAPPPAAAASQQSEKSLSLWGLFKLIGKWMISDYIVFFLGILILLIVGFAVTIAAWTNRDLESLCNFNPRLTHFYNGLWSAFVTILPGCFIATLLLPFMARTKRSRSNTLSRRGWTRPRIYFMCLFVAAVTMLVAPWTQDILHPSWKMSCDPFLKDEKEASVTISASNYTEFCANVWRKPENEFSAQAEAWKNGHKGRGGGPESSKLRQQRSTRRKRSDVAVDSDTEDEAMQTEAELML